MNKVCILDYGSGNVRSVLNAFSKHANCTISNDVKEIQNSSHLILPGVGSYKNSMKLIQERIPIEVLKEEVRKGKPLLGICVGMQVLGTTGIEFEEAQGLSFFPGQVAKLNSNYLPLPHVGWNNLVSLEDDSLTKGITEEDDFYFVHSYVFIDLPKDTVIAKADYGSLFPAMIRHQNIFGVQFHPEKSQSAGIKVIKNFLDVK